MTDSSLSLASNSSSGISASFCHFEDSSSVMFSPGRVLRETIVPDDNFDLQPFLSCPLSFNSLINCPARRSARSRISMALRSASRFNACREYAGPRLERGKQRRVVSQAQPDFDYNRAKWTCGLDRTSER